MKNIGKLIHTIREKRGISCSELAEGICSTKYIYMIEKEQRLLSIKILYEISKKLKFDFFHAIPYLSVENPIALKDAINMFIKFRLENNLEDIGAYCARLRSSDHYYRSDFNQLVAFHEAYIRLKDGTLCSEVFEKLEEALALSSNESCIDIDIDERYSYSYSEFLVITMIAVCKFYYYKEYNVSMLERLYELSKNFIRTDESIDIALFILRTLFALYDYYNRKEEKNKYIIDFKICFMEILDNNTFCMDNAFLKRLISLNVDLIASRNVFIKNSEEEVILEVYFIEPCIVILKTIGIHKDVFELGIEFLYEEYGKSCNKGKNYHFVGDFSSLLKEDVGIKYFSLDEARVSLLKGIATFNLTSTYFVIPSLNRTMLDLLLFYNRINNNIEIHQPQMVSSILDAILKIKKHKNNIKERR